MTPDILIPLVQAYHETRFAWIVLRAKLYQHARARLAVERIKLAPSLRATA